MIKPVVVIKKSPRDYQGLADLGNKVIAAMTGNGNFTAPTPTMAILQTAVTDVEDAIKAWGTPGHRGSHTQLLDLRQKSQTLFLLLSSEGGYVQTTAQIAAGSDYATMTSIISTSGFDIKMVPVPQGTLEMPQNFRRVPSRKLNDNQALFEWKIPANATSASNVGSYNFYQAATADFATAKVVGTPTKTSFIVSNNTSAPVTLTFWVVAVGAAGEGVRSEPISIVLAGI